MPFAHYLQLRDKHGRDSEDCCASLRLDCIQGGVRLECLGREYDRAAMRVSTKESHDKTETVEKWRWAADHIVLIQGKPVACKPAIIDQAPWW
jgi:hypothetical protein